jgi:FtsH-binding integral membrane protein
MEPNKFSAPDNNWEQNYDQVASIPDSKFMATYMSKVYGWMFLGLMITALVAYFVSTSETALQYILGSRIIFFGLIFGQLILVGYLVVRILKMSAITATLVFLGYAALNGITFSVILLAYTPGSLMSVFAITAGTFGIMSAVGYFTKQDLTSFGRIMMMGLIGVILASLVNFFMHSSTLYWIISYVAVAVFVGLIAYDTQKIKAYALLEKEEDRKKGAIMGALALYLDFVNLFIFLLRLFGRRN